ncbi:MAG: caspase family protein [Bacteroidota bacterium]
MAKLYALLVGINEYHPQSEVSNLDGCVNDMLAMKAFIERNYADLSPDIVTLKNSQATTTNIIRTFREQLVQKARTEDIALLYYAGHGSFAPTAPEFEQFDGQRQDESLVCYDSRLPDHHDLTDKEIAVLLSEISSEAHTVLIVDACHSASISRKIGFSRNPMEDIAAEVNLGKRRFTPGKRGTRNLSSYLQDTNNFYTKLGDNLHIPRSKHLLLSACDRNEEAWETDDRRGLFTTTLLSVLEEDAAISYRDLFARVRRIVFDTARNQQPTLYPYEGFNPNTVFLRPTVLPNTKRHQIKYDIFEKAWRLELGAIHGLPASPDAMESILVGVYQGMGETATFVKNSQLSQIHIDESTLADVADLDKNQTYWGEMLTVPTQLLVNLEGHPSTVRWFLKKYNQDASPFINFAKKFRKAEYTLRVTRKKWTISLTATKKVITEIETDDQALSLVKKKLVHIADWENVANLTNPTSTINNSLEVEFLEETAPRTFETHTERDIVLDYPKVRAGEPTPTPIWYQIRVRNVSDRDLYVSLFNLNAEFGVNVHFPNNVIPAQSDWVTLDNEHGLIIEDENARQVTDAFKIIASTTAFDDYKYLMKELNSSSRKAVKRRDFDQKIDDWYTETLTVNTVRGWGQVGVRPQKMGDITFEAHSTLTANLSVIAPSKGSRSVADPRNLNRIFGQSELVEVLSTESKRSRNVANPATIFELSDISGASQLADNPLKINIQTRNKSADTVLPVTLQNGFIVPIGTSLVRDDGTTEVSITKIPQEIDGLTKGPQKRSLGRALWFSLLKLTGVQSDVFKLRKLVFKNQIPERIKLHQPSVNSAKKILLVIHGIIGDTKTIVPNLAFLQEKGHYDLILTFDYENLNTKIEDIAKKLNKKLEKYGLGANDGKRFDILAHSMGGLVSRYLIEHVRKGDDLVDNLYMFGTPNGGSVFGEIPAYRDKLVKLLTIGLNFGKAWLGWVGTALSAVNKMLIGSAMVTKTLAQMSSESELIDKLNNSEPVSTKYTVVAGDISNYENIKEVRLARLVEQVLLKIGEAAHTKAPNDIAVLVEDIRKIPAEMNALKYDVCCHHLNYFESEEGLRMVSAVLIGLDDER